MPDSILVVDDEQPIRKIVASMLGTAGYACKQAASGLEALALLGSGDQCDLILSDFMMPELDGIGLLERAKEKYPDVPFVMTSEVPDLGVALTAFRGGASDYLLKPFEREQLLSTVKRTLETCRQKLENLTYRTNLESLVKARTDQLQAAMSSLERSYDMTLEGFGDALALKDAETEGHSKRVTAFTIAVSRAIGLPREQINTIARGAFLHDIGKMATPEAILCKPDRLNPDETTIMRQHPVHGYQMVKKIPFLSEAAEIVYAHHEHFDGSGYPRCLKGEQIPLGARIVAVANTLDSITSDLPYRPARTLDAARDEIRRWLGRQFDPEIVNVFLQMPDNIWEDLRQHIVAAAQRSVPPTPISGNGRAR
jgi:putative nucleotidyltransferase with HDIG domain